MRQSESTLTDVEHSFGGKLEVNATEAERTSEWRDWLADEWYGQIIHYKLFGELDSYTDQNGEPLTARK